MSVIEKILARHSNYPARQIRRLAVQLDFLKSLRDSGNLLSEQRSVVNGIMSDLEEAHLMRARELTEVSNEAQ